LAPKELAVCKPLDGNKFEFDSLSNTQLLILCTSSQNGFPPFNMVEFAHQLLLAAETGPVGCLSHLRHAVWGNGSMRWRRTYMNMPRYMDLLLERCGSRRIYARGEANEPHAPTCADKCELEPWAIGMWQEAMRMSRASSDSQGAVGDGSAAVPWNALWDYQGSRLHHDVTEWSLKEVVQYGGELRGLPSMFARPCEKYANALAEVRRERQERDERRRAALEEARKKALSASKDVE
jgi:hypothetical protein